MLKGANLILQKACIDVQLVVIFCWTLGLTKFRIKLISYDELKGIYAQIAWRRSILIIQLPDMCIFKLN